MQNPPLSINTSVIKFSSKWRRWLFLRWCLLECICNFLFCSYAAYNKDSTQNRLLSFSSIKKSSLNFESLYRDYCVKRTLESLDNNIKFPSSNGRNEERTRCMGENLFSRILTRVFDWIWLRSEDGTVHFSGTAHDLWAHNHTHVIKSALMKKR